MSRPARVGLRASRRLPDRGRQRLLQHLFRRGRADRRLGVSWTLPRLIGQSRAADLLLFPRDLRRRRRYELGIANKVVPAAELAAEAAAVARELAEGPTAAYAALKESLAYGAGHTLTETLEKEDELQSRAGASEDHAIAVQAFLDKAKPKYPGPLAPPLRRGQASRGRDCSAARWSLTRPQACIRA